MAQSDSPAKNSFVLYCDLLQKLERLTVEQKGFVFQAILEFQNGIEPQVDDPLAQLSFDFIKPDLIKNNEKYQEAINRSRENGKKGGRPRKENPVGFNETQKTQPVYEEPKPFSKNLENPDNDNENDNENDIKNITAPAVASFLSDKFGQKKQVPPALSWQSDATRLAEAFRLDLDSSYEKKSGQSYKIADSWFKLFRDGGGQVVGRLEAAYSFFADQERFFELSDGVKWGYLRDIAHSGLDQFKRKGVL